MIKCLLQVLVPCSQAPEVGHSSGDTSGSTAMSPDDVESMLLMAVDKLYREDREVDVQLGLLSVVLQVLQRHGKSIPKQLENTGLRAAAL